MKNKYWLIGTLVGLLITVLQPVNQVAEALVHFRYAEVGGIAIAMPGSEAPESDDIPAEVEQVVEPHRADFDLTRPYKGQVIGDGRVTSTQGKRPPPCPGCSTQHRGVDWAKSREGGEPLYAPGKVEVVCKFQANGAGHYAQFNYQGMRWMVFHMMPNTCVPGGHERGWIIGRVGRSGNVSGVHAHIELRGPRNEELLVGTGHVHAIVVQNG
jgi:murein DD-endopeptidase MepM/ murein hydrolase activator NlpD